MIFQEFADHCHSCAKTSGWWTNITTKQPLTLSEVNIGEKLMLIVSEVAEGMEGHRKSLMDDKLTHRTRLEVELADAIIRICDLAGFLGYNLQHACLEKLAYNAQREDHKLENRMKAGGKAY